MTIGRAALIVVDLQNDFCPGGALAVPEGYDVAPVANMVVNRFNVVVATQDWHPANHGSFASNHPGKSPYDQIMLNGLPQTLWPDHCIQNSYGAEIDNEFDTSPVDRIFQKGTDPEVDSYSGFYDNGGVRSTGLAEYLKQRDVDRVWILGLATDYCVKFTVLDALRCGFHANVIEDACRAVNLSPGDGARALAAMQAAGANICLREDLTG